jgi:diguanylate cyclase (GGDEF)-like protein
MSGMAAARQPRALDFPEIRARVQSIEAGTKLMLVIAAGGCGYAISTWDQPHRALLASLFAVAAGIAVLLSLLPHERIVRSRGREAFFLATSSATIALSAATSAVDGGANSPLSLLFFLPLVFAALSFPLASVVVIGALDYSAYVVVGVTGDAPSPQHVGFFALCLASMAVICAWHARNQDRRREELARVSRADPLTGCLNRRGFEERFAGELGQAARSGCPLGLVMIDLDRFKHTNDSLGHAAGDDLLCWAVDTMQAFVRPLDSVGRLGGDEFALLLPGAGALEVESVSDRLQAALAERAPASMGIATFPADGTEQGELFRRADQSLYTGKQGRSLTPATRKDLSWATALACAVEERITIIRHEHSRQVADYAMTMGRALGWTEDECELLEMAAILHDVGKVSLPDRLLRKEEPLSASEWEEIQLHPVTGAEIASRIEGLDAIVPWIRHSHEHYDGSGYPDGLSRDGIPLASRVLHVADAFDAMVSGRPYRAAKTVGEAHAELRANAGTQFDPGCVALFEEYCVPLFHLTPETIHGTRSIRDDVNAVSEGPGAAVG